MKKVIFILLFFCVMLVASNHTVHAVTQLERLDIWLIALLNDETDPFFPDTIRHDFIKLGIKKVSSVCKTGAFKWTCDVDSSGSMGGFAGRVTLPDFSGMFVNILNFTAVLHGDSSYALLEIDETDVGRRSIYTTSEMQYWFVGERALTSPKIYVYPAPAIKSTVIVFGYGTPKPQYMSAHYEHLVVLYAFHLCYLRKGEEEIAFYIKSLFDTLLQDMYVITESRKVNATIKKKVIPQ